MNNKSRKTVEQWATEGNPEARFVVSVKRARAAGAPQYGERFAAWLRTNGQNETEISDTINRLNG